MSKCKVSTVVLLRSREVKLPEAPSYAPVPPMTGPPGLPPLNRTLTAIVPFRSRKVASQRKVLRPNLFLAVIAVHLKKSLPRRRVFAALYRGLVP